MKNGKLQDTDVVWKTATLTRQNNLNKHYDWGGIEPKIVAEARLKKPMLDSPASLPVK